ncbi:MAG: glycosyltransferase family 87 protein [Flavobacteriales bacterium]
MRPRIFGWAKESPYTMSERFMIRAVLATAILFSLVIDFSLTRKYGGVDLRDKVVGARSLMAGRSMYFNPWSPGEPERFADPMVPPGATMTRYTGTPFQALVMSPMGMLSFGTLRVPWLLAQYALLLLAIALAHRAFSEDGWRMELITGLVLVAVLTSTSWRLHVERGQVYIGFAALIAALFWSLAKERHLLAGVLAAALVLFKPTYAFLLLPLVMRVNVRLVAGAAILVVTCVGVFAIIPNGLASWGEYLEAMRVWSTMPGVGAPPSANPDAFTYPATIEGLSNLRDHHAMEFENGSVAAVLIAVVGIELPGLLPWAVYAMVLLGSAIALRGRIMSMPRVHLLLLGFAAWTALMMLLPTPRFDYQLVHWIAPALLLLHAWRERPMASAALLAIAGVLVVGGWSVLPVNILLAEALLLVACGWMLMGKQRAMLRETE